MNQTLKDAIYRLGSDAQLDYLCEVGGLNDDEKTMLRYYHDGRTDTYVMVEMHLSRAAHLDMEERLRRKLLLAVFTCINRCMSE